MNQALIPLTMRGKVAKMQHEKKRRGWGKEFWIFWTIEWGCKMVEKMCCWPRALYTLQEKILFKTYVASKPTTKAICFSVLKPWYTGHIPNTKSQLNDVVWEVLISFEIAMKQEFACFKIDTKAPIVQCSCDIFKRKKTLED